MFRTPVLSPYPDLNEPSHALERWPQPAITLPAFIHAHGARFQDSV